MAAVVKIAGFPMSGSDIEHRQPVTAAALQIEETDAAARATVIRGEMTDWSEKLRRARAMRQSALEKRGASDEATRLIRPDARPPFSPPAGELPPGIDPKMVPFAPVAEPSVQMETPKSADPGDVSVGRRRSVLAASALHKVLARRSDAGGHSDPAPAETPRRFSSFADLRDMTLPRQVVGAFALGVGLGVPLAAVAWLLMEPKDPVGQAPAAAYQAAEPALTKSEQPTSEPPVSAPPQADLAADTQQPATVELTEGTALGSGSVGTLRQTPLADAMQTVEALQASAGPAQSELGSLPIPAASPLSEDLGLSHAGTSGAQAAAPQTGLSTDNGGRLAHAPTTESSNSHASDVASAPMADNQSEDLTAAAPPASAIRPIARPGSSQPDSPVSIPADPAQTDPVIERVSQVRVYAPSRVPAGEMSAIAANLRQSGVQIVDPVRTGLTIRDTHIRYYHQGDTEAASAVAAQIGAVARDFTSYSPSPPEGMLELWVAGTGVASPARGGPPNDPIADVARGLGSAISRLLSSIPPSDPQH